MNQQELSRGHWADGAWRKAHAGPAGESPGTFAMDVDGEDAGLWMHGLSSFDDAPELDVLCGLAGQLEACAEEQAAWHDLSGADEPDWHFHLGFDALDSFAGFEGFDDSVDGPDGDVVFGRDETGARAWGNSGHPSPSVRGPGADVLRPAVESDDARIITIHGH